jgi:CubicO group peptidase (beta-lactamase class C family)
MASGRVTLAGDTGAENLEALVGPVAQEAIRSAPIAGLTVAISRAGRQVFVKGYGLADLENRVAASADTVYSFKSITKSFTAAAILQLREQRKLELDEEVGHLLPNLPAQWRSITIRQLLTHTGGLPDYGGELFRENIGKDIMTAEWVHAMADQPLLFEPGAGWSYSNLGYDVLGLIIEKLSGRSYAEYVSSQFVMPFGLEHTRVLDREAIISHRARSYTLDPTQKFVNARSWGTYGIPAGALGGTVADLLKWEYSLQQMTALALPAKRLMETPAQLSIGIELDYGFGTRLGMMGPHRVVAHSGDGEGWTSAAVRIDDADLVVVVLTNTESYARHAQIIACSIARRILSISDPVINDLALTSAEQAGFAGKYGNGLQILSQNGVLFVQLWPGGPRSRLLYQGKGTFVLDSARDMMLDIKRDHRGANWVEVRAGGVFAFAVAHEHENP